MSSAPGDEIFEEGYLGHDYVFYLIITAPMIGLILTSLVCTACYYRGRYQGNSQDAFLPTYVNYKQMKKSDKEGFIYMIYNLGFQRGRKLAFDEGKALRPWQIQNREQRRLSLKAEMKAKAYKEEAVHVRRASWRPSICGDDLLAKLRAEFEGEANKNPDDSLAQPATVPGESNTETEEVKLNNGTKIKVLRRGSNADLSQICDNLGIMQF